MSKEWTICEAQYLCDNYGQIPRGEIASALSRTAISVKDMASYFGIQRKKAPGWTTEDVEKLAELWGVKPVRLIAKALNRTESAIILKAKRIGLGNSRNAFGRLTANQLANALGVDVKTITERWIPKNGLKCFYRTTRTVRKFHLIELDDFWKWAETNQEKFDSRRIELGILGKEPAWMVVKRKADYQGSLKRPRKWTPEEDAVLRRLFKQGLTYGQITENMGRSVASVSHRLAKISIWEQPVKKVV